MPRPLRPSMRCPRPLHPAGLPGSAQLAVSMPVGTGEDEDGLRVAFLQK